jgi:beta-galactosidase
MYPNFNNKWNRLASRLLLFLVPVIGLQASVERPQVLNGPWLVKDASGHYTREVIVPGIINDPSKMDDGPVWLKRDVVLPSGDWETVSVLFKGARYNPAVYVNGDKVSFREGGMGPRTHYVEHADLRPGNKVTLEVELMSLADMSEDNASYTPIADHWRSSISAYLWDDVVLEFHRGVAINRMIPFTDIHQDKVDVHVFPKFLHDEVKGGTIRATLSQNGSVLTSGDASFDQKAEKAIVTVPFDGKVQWWSPDTPHLYDLTIELMADGQTLDQRTYTYGAKEFKLDASGKQFVLNGKPFRARANTVVWPRWVRNPEGYELAWDEEWFEKNIVLRSKALGVNTLRFHLGNAPEKYIDLCNKHGLLVQYEWSFFHGMPATVESLLDQWTDWFDLGVRQASVGLYHPYNETNPEWLPPAWTAINQIIEDYPPLLIADREVTHVHKYWWSLFENLGLYYDSYEQFPTAIMVDEFGGNYLDANYDYGLYKTVRDTFRRFLGDNETVAQRVKMHTQSNVKVGEYWRRIGAAGYSPFCALGSHEDGSHWFEGDLKEGNPKPVWEALAVIWSPLAASIDLWDQNFVGGQVIDVPVHFINDTAEAVEMEVLLTVEVGEARLFKQTLRQRVEAFGTTVESYAVTLPVTPGEYWIKAELLNEQPEIAHRVVSEWDFRILEVKRPDALDAVVLAIPDFEPELKAFADAQGLKHVRPGSGEDYDILALSRNAWLKIADGDKALKDYMDGSVAKGRSVLLLDVGPGSLGQGYPGEEGNLGPLQGVARIYEQENVTTHVFGNISLLFGQAPEPESHVHAHPDNPALWNHLEEDDVWLWNGYRGGLIVPADLMEVLGLSREGFFDLWVERGAAPEAIRSNPAYTAYELQGYYAFSSQPDVDETAVIQGLRDHIKFIQADAPAIAAYIDPGAPVEILKLNQEYEKLSDAGERNLSVEPLAMAGKKLKKTPVQLIRFEGSNSQVLASQFLTRGRLAEGFGSDGHYGIRYDPAAVQMVLNMIELLVSSEAGTQR